MKNTQILSYSIFGILFSPFCLTGNVFATLNIDTFLRILPPNFRTKYSPPYIAGQYTNGAVYVSITGDGIRANESPIRENGTYNFNYYRGTGPFITGAAYSSGNTRTMFSTTKTIDWIDNILPTFVGVQEGIVYTTPVSILYTNNNPGVTATLNGSSFINGSSLSTNGIYQFIVSDAAGNRTGATFSINISSVTPPSGGGGGGGGRYDGFATGDGIDPLCEDRNCYSSYYEYLCGPCIPPSNSPLPNQPPYNYITPDYPIIIGSSYSKERNDAYQRAYRLGITTISPIQEANLEGVLYRKIAAKMISEFASKVVGIVPDETRNCEFNDIKNEDPELQYFMKLSCQLGIMGLDYYGNPDTVFNPNYFVTRDQFVTMLSRTLFRGKYNLFPEEYMFVTKLKNFAIHTINNVSSALKLNMHIDSPLDWYTKHLEIIKQLGVITDYRVSIKEFKIYVILIMYRMDLRGIDYIQSLGQ